MPGFPPGLGRVTTWLRDLTKITEPGGMALAECGDRKSKTKGTAWSPEAEGIRQAKESARGQSS